MISRPLPNCCARKSLDFKVYQVCCMGLDGWGECFRGRLRHCSRWWLLLFGVCFRGVKANQNSWRKFRCIYVLYIYIYMFVYIYICSSQALKNGRTSRLAIPLGPIPPFSFPWLSWSVKFQKKTDLCSFNPQGLPKALHLDGTIGKDGRMEAVLRWESTHFSSILIPEPKHVIVLVVTITGKGDNPTYISISFLSPWNVRYPSMNKISYRIATGTNIKITNQTLVYFAFWETANNILLLNGATFPTVLGGWTKPY